MNLPVTPDELVARHANAERDDLLQDVDRVLVGCSGGADSTVLLETLCRFRCSRGLEVAVAHLNHCWRGGESNRDQDKVAALAEEFGVSFFSRKAPVVAGRCGPEATARASRLSFFRSVARCWAADALALGHNADDQAETVLLNLCRGSARAGLSGMRARRRLDGLLVIRPLLGCRRDAIRQYARGRGLRWVEDSSNKDRRFTRNRIRGDLMPILESIAPGAVRNLVRAAAILEAEERWLDVLIDGDYAAIRDNNDGDVVALKVGQLRSLQRSRQRRLVRRAVEQVRGGLDGIGAVHVEAVLETLERGEPRSRDLPGVRVRLLDDRLVFLPLQGRILRAPA